jgi:hypothetical protein
MDLTYTIRVLEQTIKDKVVPHTAVPVAELAALSSSLKDLQLASLIQDIRDGRVKLGGISNIHGDNIVGPG